MYKRQINPSLKFDALAKLSVEELKDLAEAGAPAMPIGMDAARTAAEQYAGTTALDSEMCIRDRLLILMTLVQIAPVKINPWSALAKAIGKAINADISKRLDEIEKKLDSHIKTDDQGRADDWRAAILRFNNELLRPIRHTKEEFVEVLGYCLLYTSSYQNISPI